MCFNSVAACLIVVPQLQFNTTEPRNVKLSSTTKNSNVRLDFLYSFFFNFSLNLFCFHSLFPNSLVCLNCKSNYCFLSSKFLLFFILLLIKLLHHKYFLEIWKLRLKLEKDSQSRGTINFICYVVVVCCGGRDLFTYNWRINR